MVDALPAEDSLPPSLPEHNVNPDIQQQSHQEGKIEGHHGRVDDKVGIRYGTDIGIT